MKYHTLFLGKNVKNIVSLTSAETAHSMMSVKVHLTGHADSSW